MISLNIDCAYKVILIIYSYKGKKELLFLLLNGDITLIIMWWPLL